MSPLGKRLTAGYNFADATTTLCLNCIQSVPPETGVGKIQDVASLYSNENLPSSSGCTSEFICLSQYDSMTKVRKKSGFTTEERAAVA